MTRRLMILGVLVLGLGQAALWAHNGLDGSSASYRVLCDDGVRCFVDRFFFEWWSDIKSLFNGW